MTTTALNEVSPTRSKLAGLQDTATERVLNPTTSTSPQSTQLFGVFDPDTMNAVIVTAREVSP